jgi:hypothetical protein
MTPGGNCSGISTGLELKHSSNKDDCRCLHKQVFSAVEGKFFRLFRRFVAAPSQPKVRHLEVHVVVT